MLRSIPLKKNYLSVSAYMCGIIFSSSDRALFLHTRDYFTSLMELGMCPFYESTAARLEIGKRVKRFALIRAWNRGSRTKRDLAL